MKKETSFLAYASIHFLWQIIFFLIPFVLLFIMSLTKFDELGAALDGFTFENYINLFGDDVFLITLVRTFVLAISVSFLVTIVSLFFVLFVWRFSNSTLKKIILYSCALIFFIGIIPKTFVISQLISDNGPLALFFKENFGIGFYFQLYSIPGLIISYLSIFCPLSILVLFISRNNVLIEYEYVAKELGASWWAIQSKIIIPSIQKGIVISLILTFILTIADVTVIDLIGGSKIYTSTSFIIDLFKIDEWGSAAAVAVILLLSITTIISLTIPLVTKIISK